MDRKSAIYYKTYREGEIYRRKLRDTIKPLIMSYIKFDENERRRLNIRRKLITQNILLVENRLKQGSLSYSRVVRGRLGQYQDTVVEWIRLLGDIVIYAFVIYGVIFIMSRTVATLMGLSFTFNTSALYLVTFSAFMGLMSRFARNFFLLAVVAVLYIIFLLFLQVNF